MLTIGGGNSDGDSLSATWSIFIELWFEFCLGYSEIYIASRVFNLVH